MQKKKNLEQRLLENTVVNPGDEEAQIKRRRNQIAEIHEEIKSEKERQTQLKAQLRAYDEIMDLLGPNGLNKEEKLIKLLGVLPWQLS